MDRLTAEKRQFVEEIAMTCEQIFGFSRMAGRMHAVLLERWYNHKEKR
jgi:DNA-binding transcriptional regulator GbsR (MarR family)